MKRGHFEFYRDGELSGWALDRDRPDEAIAVTLVVDDLIVTTVEAAAFRRDLKAAGHGNGNHGFAIKVPARFFDSAPHKMTLLIDTDGDPIANTPQVLVFGDKEAAPKLPEEIRLTKSTFPLVTLVMPTYNRGDRMESTIRALSRCRGWDDAELVVVDDGSRDDTSARLDRLSSEFPNIVARKVENGGPGRARNIAASIASAPIILFVGDDVAPVDEFFIDVHVKAHRAYPDQYSCILGKIGWPNDATVNYVMQHIQGEGQQQFGYKYLEPYKWYDWRFFYSSNVSVKRHIVGDWRRYGYDEGFSQYGYEDAEFAYRITTEQAPHNREFKILYVPAARLVHYHPYSVQSFIRRQESCGMMARRFVEKHPAVSADIGVGDLSKKLDEQAEGVPLPVDSYFAIFEGIQAWAVVLEQSGALGSQNWHADLLKAVFHLTYLRGYLRAINRAEVNVQAAAKYLLDTLIADLGHAVFIELLGSHSSTRLV